MAKTKHDANNPANRCRQLCRARCCRYLTIYIPAPRRKADFDELSWFLAHENISIYFDARRWHVEVRTRCKYLNSQNLCAIYETRPAVCRGYDLDECEYPERPKHDLQFDTKQEFDAWWEKKRVRERLRRRQRSRPARKGTGAR